ncbi:hypothetical protein HZA38_04465 [Candidatus Peregrinibacteria bacterium]|nr:hypothetical protein [Candidatus Peregrinibacteria bacterium]
MKSISHIFRGIFVISFMLMCFAEFTLASAAGQIPVEQRNKRQLVVLWQESQVFGQGFHRPYSALVLEDENDDKLWEGNTDAKGAFSFLLPVGTVNPAREHTLLLKAYDQFGRDILKDDGTPDTLKARVLPGLQAEGKTDPNAEILLLDSSGKLLNKFESDENGNYVVFNAPEGSTLKIQKDEKYVEIPFQKDNIGSTYVNEGSTTIPKTNTDPKQNSTPSQVSEASGSSLLYILGGVVIAALLGVGILFRKKRKEENF